MAIRWRAKRSGRKRLRPWTIGWTIRRADGSLWLLPTPFAGWWQRGTKAERRSFSARWRRLSASQWGAPRTGWMQPPTAGQPRSQILTLPGAVGLGESPADSQALQPTLER